MSKSKKLGEQRGTINAIRHNGESVQQLIDHLSNRNANIRHAAEKELVRLGSRAVYELIDGLEPSADGRQTSSSTAVGLIGYLIFNVLLILTFAEAIRTSHWRAVVVAAWWIVVTGLAARTLLAKLRQRKQILRVLCQIEDSRSLPYHIRSLDGATTGHRRDVLPRLARILLASDRVELMINQNDLDMILQAAWYEKDIADGIIQAAGVHGSYSIRTHLFHVRNAHSGEEKWTQFVNEIDLAIEQIDQRMAEAREAANVAKLLRPSDAPDAAYLLRPVGSSEANEKMLLRPTDE
jgi:hypothetical protein